MTQAIKIIIGPPGTGKTTRLLDIMETEIKNGVQPNRIAFCSFTKKAAEEAADRAMDRFGFSRKDLPHFKTNHSLAFYNAGIKKKDVVGPKDLKVIGEHLGLKFNLRYGMTEVSPYTINKGDQYLFIDGFSRARMIEPMVIWDKILRDELNWYEFLRFQDTYNQYKKDRNLVDFADMLKMGDAPIDVDVLIIDEAQDLSTAQWHFIRNTFSKAKRVYIGGDDDQAIFSWSGADVEYFLGIKGEREILRHSYRIPKKVHDFAESISSRIRHRTKKEYIPRKEEGSVSYWNAPDHVDLSSGTWLLLARNAYLLDELQKTVKNQGYIYSVKGEIAANSTHIRAIQLWERGRKGQLLTDAEKDALRPFLGPGQWPSSKIWHEAFVGMDIEDREYYISILRRGQSLTAAPRINISTIHGVKGGEADNVLLLSDQSYLTWEGAHFDQDSEHRVWYVGATRCRNNLHIVLPRGRYGYDL